MSGRSLSQSSRRAQSPIGVFDSGLGGLTIVREIRRKLPQESILYFGDLAHLPYGIKSKEQIIKFSKQNADFLLKKKVKAIVVACNSSSSVALNVLRQQYKVPLIDVISPAARDATEKTQNQRIGVIATQATVESGAYEKAIEKIASRAKVFSAPCDLFVPFVEEGRTKGRIIEQVAKGYLAPLLSKKIDTLILGCTHYPLLRSIIQRVVGKNIKLVDSMAPAALSLKQGLETNKLLNPGVRKGSLKVYVSDKPCSFVRLGEAFLKEKINRVEVVKD